MIYPRPVVVDPHWLDVLLPVLYWALCILFVYASVRLLTGLLR